MIFNNRLVLAAVLLSLGISGCSDSPLVTVIPPDPMDAGEISSPVSGPGDLPAVQNPAGAIPGDVVPPEGTTEPPEGTTPGAEQPAPPETTPPPTTTETDTEVETPVVNNDPWWQPKASDKLKWQWQLQGDIDVTLPVQVYNIDIDAPQDKVDQLNERGIKIICYFSAGTVEAWRDDAALFAPEIIGEQYEDLVDEQWVDYANIDALAPIMRARMDTCKSKGFHAIEIDNVDAHNYESRDAQGEVVNIGTNFKMTLNESIAYVTWLASEAHSRGLSIGLKNAEEMVADVVDVVDWMLVEDCYYDSWCNAATGFIDANKPVFMAEYDELVPDFAPACELAKALGFSAIWRESSLSDGLYLACE